MPKFTIEASFAYGITKPGEVPYSSENYRAAATITEEIEAEDFESASAIAEARNAQLAQSTKLATINEAGLTAVTDDNGVLSPSFGSAATAAKPAPAKPSPAAQAAAEGDPAPRPDDHFDSPKYDQQGGGQRWDGRPVTIFDNRESKKSERAPDFRIRFEDVGPDAPDDVKYKPIWLTNPNGSVNQAGLAVAAMVDGS
jgi:hypothetical protein